MADYTLAEIVQQAYPKRWHACHVEHRTRGRPHGSGLTDRGRGALRSDSVLDADRVAAVLDQIPADEREIAVRGLATLAAAAARLRAHTPTGTS